MVRVIRVVSMCGRVRMEFDAVTSPAVAADDATLRALAAVRSDIRKRKLVAHIKSRIAEIRMLVKPPLMGAVGRLSPVRVLDCRLSVDADGTGTQGFEASEVGD